MEGLSGHNELTGIAIVALAALGCGLAMMRLRQPALVGYILAGVLLGPSGLGLVENRETIGLLAELGVLLLLFLLGMELSLRAFREVWRISLFTTMAQIAAGVALMLLFALATGRAMELAILLGFAVAVSSTAVCIKMLEETGELRTRVGQITVGVLIAQDLAVVPMMLTLRAIGDGAGAGLGWEAVLRILLSIGFLALLIVQLSRRERVKLPFARSIGRDGDLVPLAALGFCFGAAAASGLLGLSPAYGAFLAGLVLGNSSGRGALIRHTAPIQSVLLMVFFLSIGLLIDLRYLWENLGAVLLLLFFVTVLKTAINLLALRFLGESWPRAFLAGVSLAQIGEFSFVLTAVGVAVGIAGPEQQRLIIAVAVLSLATAPLYLALARRLHQALLLGITSGRETVRVTFGPSVAALQRSARVARAYGDLGAERIERLRGRRRAKARAGEQNRG